MYNKLYIYIRFIKCITNNKNHIMTTDSGSKTTVLFTEALPHLYVKQTKFHCKPLKPHPYAYFLT